MVNLKIFFSCLLVTVSLVTFGQKLPNVQQAGLPIPGNIKIDGKANEWDNKFQAYNKSTEIFYTIANSNSDLYLILYANNTSIIKKIIQGGVSFTINIRGENNFKNSVVITYPHYDTENKPYSAVLSSRSELANDITKNDTRADSLMKALNKQLASRLKMIGVEGVKAIEDSVISVYNNDGIKAVGLFDSQLNYTYELSVPLKYLNLNVNKPVKFKYNLKLNGPIPKNANVILSGGGTNYIVMIGDNQPYAISARSPTNLTFPTDFWGEYELVK